MAIDTHYTPKPVDIEEYRKALPTGSTRPELCNSVIPALIDAIARIAEQLQQSQQVLLAGSANAFGDDQLNVDLIAEKIIRNALARCPVVATATSEEDPIEKPVERFSTAESTHEEEANIDKSASDSESYTVAFDPLDGSSIIDSNWAVGSIVGIWDGTSTLNRCPRHTQVAAVVGLYGPRTTVLVALNIPNEARVCFEIGLNKAADNTAITLVRPVVKLDPPPHKHRYFSPANLRAAAENPKYANLITHFVQSKYTLRYSGGLVPDIVHMLTKGHGIYISPTTKASKAKLRLLYELYPIALIIETAGGSAISPDDGKHILDHVLTNCDQRAGLVCGMDSEVSFVDAALRSEKQGNGARA